MGIAGVGYNTNYIYYQHTGSKTEKSTETQTTAQKEGQISNRNPNGSDGAIFISEAQDGASFAIYKADGYSEENPLMTIKGVNQKGETYEQQVNPRTVDSTNASYAEIMAMNAYFVEIGELDVKDMGAIERLSENDLEKSDYMTALRQSRDAQYDAGNIVGYHQASNVCNALINLQQEQNGTEKYITGLSGETVRAYAMEGRLKSGIVGFSSVGQGDELRLLEARYADNSTTDNPVMEVRISRESGETQIFQVNINDIDPRNASQMEMFALCSHADAQGISDEGLGKTSYMKYLECAGQSGMEASNTDDFVNKKQDWTQMKNSISSTSEMDKNSPEDKWLELLGNLFEHFINNLADELSDSGKIMDMVTGENRFSVTNSAYDISQEEDGFSVTDKENGNIYHYKNEDAQVLKDMESGVSYLLNVDENNKVTEKMEVNDQLLANLNVFFMTNHIKPGEMSQDIKSQISETNSSESSVEPLLSESIRSTDESDSPEKKDKLYITWYNEDGIFCREQGQTEGYLWSVPFNGKEDYTKIVSFLNHFGQDDNLQFAHDENFWRNFLAGKVNEEDWYNKD